MNEKSNLIKKVNVILYQVLLILIETLIYRPIEINNGVYKYTINFEIS